MPGSGVLAGLVLGFSRFPKSAVPSQQTKTVYGVQFPATFTQSEIELLCFANDQKEENGGLGRYGHAVNGINLIYNKRAPTFIWNEWTELMIYEFCYGREVTIAGPGASWKTTCMACFGHLRWLSSPLNTRGIFTSTTMQALKAKIWKEVLRFHRASGQPFGNVVNHPQPKIQSTKGDDGFGLFGIAVEAGDIEKAVENIKGMHAPNTFVMADEETGVSMAIVDAGANLEKGTTWYQLFGSGNPVDPYDTHGMMSEPKDGWRSVSVESDKWITKRGGICIHLDGLKAPNVLAGKAKYPGMLTLEDVEISKKRDGENSPKFWSQVRGFWPPEGITDTVLTHTLIEKFRAREEPIWVDQPRQVASLDPAFTFGGDRVVLRFGKVGRIDDNNELRTALCFTETILIKLDVTTKEPIHYQVAKRTREECKARGISPEMFAMDVSGEGGIASIFEREWSPDFLKVKFGGAASDKPLSDINPRPSSEDYANRVTELWYQFRAAVERNQIRGLDMETAREFCERNYGPRGSRTIVESKIDMKARMGHSPDLADAAVIMLELVLVRGLLPSESHISDGSKRNTWSDFARKMNVETEYAEEVEA